LSFHLADRFAVRKRSKKLLGLALAVVASSGVALGPRFICAAIADETKGGKTAQEIAEKQDTADDETADKQSDTAEQGDGSGASSDGTANGTGEAATPTQNQQTDASSTGTQQRQSSSEDPAEQSIVGGAVSDNGAKALDHYDLARFYFSHWQLGLSSVEYEVTIMYAPGMKIAHRDYCLISLLTGHPLRALAEGMMVVGLGDPIPLNADEQKELMQRASKTHYRKALVYARESNWDNAVSELQWALTYTPDKPAVVRSLAFCYASKGDFTKAEQEYNKGFALDPDDAFSHADFANLLAANGQAARAEGQLNQALKVAPQVAALHVDMGWLAETQGDYAKASTEMKEAIKLCPKQPGLYLQLGKILERTGNAGEAKDAYSKALALDSGEDEARARLEKLKGAGATNAPEAAQKAKNPS
jgi:Flp pilus assembly protein TadD